MKNIEQTGRIRRAEIQRRRAFLGWPPLDGYRVWERICNKISVILADDPQIMAWLHTE